MTTEDTFTTERLPLAVFLHASQRLRFSHCELVDADRVQFVFSDPRGIGDQAELDFENGEPVPAKAIFASQTYIRRQMSAALNQDHRRDNRTIVYGYSR